MPTIIYTRKDLQRALSFWELDENFRNLRTAIDTKTLASLVDIDVTGATLQNNQILTYNASTQKWENTVNAGLQRLTLESGLYGTYNATGGTYVGRLGGALLENTTIGLNGNNFVFTGSTWDGIYNEFKIRPNELYSNYESSVNYAEWNNNSWGTTYVISQKGAIYRSSGYDMRPDLAEMFSGTGNGALSYVSLGATSSQASGKPIGLFAQRIDSTQKGIRLLDTGIQIGMGATGSTNDNNFKGIYVGTNKDIRFDNYPSTRLDGTSVRFFYPDAQGNVKVGTVTVGTFEAPLTFNNGLTRGGNIVKLGGTLSENTFINMNGKSFTVANDLGDYKTEQYMGSGYYSLKTYYQMQTDMSQIEMNANSMVLFSSKDGNGPQLDFYADGGANDMMKLQSWNNANSTSFELRRNSITVNTRELPLNFTGLVTGSSVDDLVVISGDQVKRISAANFANGNFIPVGEKAAVNGVATLGADGKIPTAQLPALAISEVYVVADLAARDALVVQSGDVAKVLNGNASGEPVNFIYDGTVWVELADNSNVDSVNGYTGHVTLTTSDVVEGTRQYFTVDRARQSLFGTSPIVYTQATGEIAFDPAFMENGGKYIWNQNATGQTANAWITGELRTNSLRTDANARIGASVWINANDEYTAGAHLNFNYPSGQRFNIQAVNDIVFTNLTYSSATFNVNVGAGYERITLHNRTSNPAAGGNGGMYFNTADNKFKGYTSSTWKSFMMEEDLANGGNYIFNTTNQQANSNFFITGQGRWPNMRIFSNAGGGSHSFATQAGDNLIASENGKPITISTQDNSGIRLTNDYIDFMGGTGGAGFNMRLDTNGLVVKGSGTINTNLHVKGGETGEGGWKFYNGGLAAWAGPNGKFSWLAYSYQQPGYGAPTTLMEYDQTSGVSWYSAISMSSSWATPIVFKSSFRGTNMLTLQSERGGITIESLGSDPLGVNGTMFYSTGTTRFRGYVNDAWKNFLMEGDIKVENGGNYIWNQNATGQTANFRITGAGRFDGSDAYGEIKSELTAGNLFLGHVGLNRTANLSYDGFRGYNLKLFASQTNNMGTLAVDSLNISNYAETYTAMSIGLASSQVDDAVIVRGYDTSASRRAFKVVNSGNTELFKVQNDSIVHVTQGHLKVGPAPAGWWDGNTPTHINTKVSVGSSWTGGAPDSNSIVAIGGGAAGSNFRAFTLVNNGTGSGQPGYGPILSFLNRAAGNAGNYSAQIIGISTDDMWGGELRFKTSQPSSNSAYPVDETVLRLTDKFTMIVGNESVTIDPTVKLHVQGLTKIVGPAAEKSLIITDNTNATFNIGFDPSDKIRLGGFNDHIMSFGGYGVGTNNFTPWMQMSDGGLTISGERMIMVGKKSSDLAGPYTGGKIFYRTDTNKFRGSINDVWKNFLMEGDVNTDIQVQNGLNKTNGPVELGGLLVRDTTLNTHDGTKTSVFTIVQRSHVDYRETYFRTGKGTQNFQIVGGSNSINAALQIGHFDHDGTPNNGQGNNALSGVQFRGINVTAFGFDSYITSPANWPYNGKYSIGVRSVVDSANNTAYNPEVYAGYFKATRSGTSGDVYALYSDGGRNYFKDGVYLGSQVNDPNVATSYNGEVIYNSTIKKFKGFANNEWKTFQMEGDMYGRSRTLTVDKDHPYATDTRTGLSNYSTDRPFKTIQKAVDLAQNNEIVFIQSGTYYETVTIDSKTLTLHFYYCQVDGGVNSAIKVVGGNDKFATIILESSLIKNTGNAADLANTATINVQAGYQSLTLVGRGASPFTKKGYYAQGFPTEDLNWRDHPAVYSENAYALYYSSGAGYATTGGITDVLLWSKNGPCAAIYTSYHMVTDGVFFISSSTGSTHHALELAPGSQGTFRETAFKANGGKAVNTPYNWDMDNGQISMFDCYVHSVSNVGVDKSIKVAEGTYFDTYLKAFNMYRHGYTNSALTSQILDCHITVRDAATTVAGHCFFEQAGGTPKYMLIRNISNRQLFTYSGTAPDVYIENNNTIIDTDVFGVVPI